MNKIKKILGILLVIVILFAITFVGYRFLKSINVEEVEILDSIDKYGYSLDDRDTDVMKDTYYELKKILNSNEVDKEKYSSCITKLFVMDLFTLNNKRNKLDVGGYEYIYPDKKDNYKMHVSDTLYKNIETNLDGKRNQELPIVKDVVINSTKKDKYKIGNTSYEAYIHSINISYEKDLGYDKKAIVTVIDKDDKLSVVEYKVGEN